MTTKYLAALALVATLAMAGPAVAHHSFAAFTMDREITIEGVVASYTLQNPHAHIVVKVPPGASDPALVGTWDVEGAAANIMRRQGWTATTLKAGDKIKLVGHPLKSGQKGLSLFYGIKPNGVRLYQDIARPKGVAK